MNLSAYEKYRKSCIPWLGVIPEHWEETSAKINYSIQLGKMLQNNPSTENDEEIAYLKGRSCELGFCYYGRTSKNVGISTGIKSLWR